MKKERLILYWILAGIIGLSYFCFCAEVFGQQKPMLGVPIDWTHPQSKGLVGCWLMNEGAGDKVFDLSGNGNIGTFGSAAARPVWQASSFGSGVYFDGSDYISITQNKGLPFYSLTQPYSIAFWIKAPLPSVSGFIISESSTASDQPFFGLTNSSANRNVVSVYIRDDAGATRQLDQGTITVFDDKLHHVVWTDYAGDGKLYVDGKLDPADLTYSPLGTYTLNRTSIAALVRATVSSYITGIIDAPMVYNRVLTASEVALLYREPFCMFEEDLPVAMYGGAPAPTGQVIIIQMSAVSIITVLAAASLLWINRRAA